MYRYIALIWNEADGEAHQVAEFLTNSFRGTPTDWDVAYDGSGLRVLHTGEEKNRMQAYSLPSGEEGSGGVVLGKLFDRPSDPATIPGNAEFDVPEAFKVIHSEGRHLVDYYWGSWVAFFQDRQKKYVLVDPIGTFCCFSTKYRDVEIYFTYMNDVAQCDFLNFSINWIPVARQIRYGVERTETGLAEVAKIRPGQCISISPWEAAQTFYWNPQEISQTNMIEDIGEAEAVLRQTLFTVTAAWAEPYNQALHQIGGLDSSILLACLKEVPTPLDVTALNIFHDAPSGDERYYARLACNQVGIPLIEYPERVEKLSFDTLTDIPLTTVPIYYAQQIALENDLSRMASQDGIQAIFNGLGGDEILYASSSSNGASDFLKSYGIGFHFSKLVMEAARLGNISVWSILPKIIFDGFRKQQWDFYKRRELGTFTLLNDNIEDLIVPQEAIHPWLNKEGGSPLGKLDHILPYTKAMYGKEGRTNPEKYISMIYPLLSQPLIELCLRIPSWVMTADGKSRGLARKAFRNYLPAEVVWRTSKLSAGSHHRKILNENFDFIKGNLLEGSLVSDDIINKSSLEKTLAREYDIGDRDLSSILILLNVEIWAQKWNKARSPQMI